VYPPPTWQEDTAPAAATKSPTRMMMFMEPIVFIEHPRAAFGSAILQTIRADYHSAVFATIYVKKCLDGRGF
jgi:hypothetical protein